MNKQKTQNESLAAALTVSEQQVLNQEIPALTHRACKAADGHTSEQIAARMTSLGWEGIKQDMASCAHMTHWDHWRTEISETVPHPITRQTSQIEDQNVSSATFFLARTMGHRYEHVAQAVFAELTGGHPMGFEMAEMQKKGQASDRVKLLYDIAPDRNAQLVFFQWRRLVNRDSAATYLREMGHEDEAIKQQGMAIAADIVGARMIAALPDSAEGVLPYIRGKGAVAFNADLVARLNTVAA